MYRDRVDMIYSFNSGKSLRRNYDLIIVVACIETIKRSVPVQPLFFDRYLFEKKITRDEEI